VQATNTVDRTNKHNAMTRILVFMVEIH